MSRLDLGGAIIYGTDPTFRSSYDSLDLLSPLAFSSITCPTSIHSPLFRCEALEKLGRLPGIDRDTQNILADVCNVTMHFQRSQENQYDDLPLFTNHQCLTIERRLHLFSVKQLNQATAMQDICEVCWLTALI